MHYPNVDHVGVDRDSMCLYYALTMSSLCLYHVFIVFSLCLTPSVVGF